MADRYGQLEPLPLRRSLRLGHQTLGERLRAAIDAKHKSHAWVAEEVGMTPGALSNILTGTTNDPSFFTVLAIARAIGEPLSAIVDDPSIFWTNNELERLRETGEWLVKRTTHEYDGAPLEIPARQKGRSKSARVHPVAASPDFPLYPSALELPKPRIPARYRRIRADAVFSVRDESMTDENIFPSDLLYVHRTSEVAEAIGRIVICTVEDRIFVKHLATRGRKLVLESAHPGHLPMEVDESSSHFQLIGIVVGTSRVGTSRT